MCTVDTVPPPDGAAKETYVCSDIISGDGEDTSDFGLILVAMLSCHCGVSDAHVSSAQLLWCQNDDIMPPACDAGPSKGGSLNLFPCNSDSMIVFLRCWSVLQSKHPSRQRAKKTPLRLTCTQWGTWWCTFCWVRTSCFQVTGDTKPVTNGLSLIITEVCWATMTKYPTSHYIDAALDRSKAIRPRLQLNDR